MLERKFSSYQYGDKALGGNSKNTQGSQLFLFLLDTFISCSCKVREVGHQRNLYEHLASGVGEGVSLASIYWSECVNATLGSAAFDKYSLQHPVDI